MISEGNIPVKLYRSSAGQLTSLCQLYLQLVLPFLENLQLNILRKC